MGASQSSGSRLSAGRTGLWWCGFHFQYGIADNAESAPSSQPWGCHSVLCPSALLSICLDLLVISLLCWAFRTDLFKGEVSMSEAVIMQSSSLYADWKRPKCFYLDTCIGHGSARCTEGTRVLSLCTVASPLCGLPHQPQLLHPNIPHSLYFLSCNFIFHLRNHCPCQGHKRILLLS